uniref:Uncharacterized protein n=1 Tax=Amphimedon queenslandica TaxID=400682 RepID=A0A1X7TGU6_AMPQE
MVDSHSPSHSPEERELKAVALETLDSDIEEEEDYPRSEHGDTTDGENEVIYYWEGLIKGVMSHPATLQLQCLLYIIGHITFEPHYEPTEDIDLDEHFKHLPVSCLGLLPRSIRIRLLYLLPAVDVAKLEGTPVTIGISMDEIWEYIFNERLPLYDKKKIERQGIGIIDTVEELMKKGMEFVTWKDAYFNAVFFFSQVSNMLRYENEDCECVYRHFIPDLYYGMGTFNSDPANTNIYQCFNTDSTYSIHRVARCTHRCPRLTPDRHARMYPSPADAPRRECEFYMSLWDAVRVMADCNVSLKHLYITHYHFKNINLKSTYFLNHFIKLLTTVEAITVHDYKKMMRKSIKKVFDIIFVQNKCSIKFISLYGSEFDIAFPYLLDASQHSLKQLELNVILDGDNSDIAYKKKSSSKHQSSSSQIQKYLPICPNESISHSIIEILQHHQDLEKLLFFMQYSYVELHDSQLTRCIADLLLRPNFKELAFETRWSARLVSFDVFLRLFWNFFSSPNPVTLSICLECPDFPPLTDPLIVNHEQESNKSLNLSQCTLSPHFSSLLPRHLVLSSFKMMYCPLDLLSSFASLESIKVKSFSLEHGHFAKDTSSAVSSLFRIVSAQEWNIIMDVSDDFIDLFTSLISEKAHLLHHFGLTNWRISTPSLLFMIQSIFSSLSPAGVPHFELTFNYRLLDDEIVKALYDLWEKHCKAVKVKKINVLDRRAFGHIKFEPPYRPTDDIDQDEHFKYLPVSCLGLLPRSIRIRLLCLLPAVDVAKLEGTPVTIGISMDEIWEYIFNERLPLHDKKKIETQDSPPLTDPFIVNHDQESNKSLDIIHFLNSLKISPEPLYFLSSLAGLESIKVKSFFIEYYSFVKETSSAISSLFRIVSAQEWNIIMTISDDVIDLFTSLISEKAHLLRHFGLMNWKISTPSLLFMIQSIFSSLSPADVPLFELSLNSDLLNDDIVKALYDLWEKHCNAVKIKKINVLDRRGYGKPSYVRILFDMATELYMDNTR